MSLEKYPKCGNKSLIKTPHSRIDMSERLKHNLKVWLIYSIFCYIILIPFQQWITNISISILLGSLFGLLNSIITELRKINEKE